MSIIGKIAAIVATLSMFYFAFVSQKYDGAFVIALLSIVVLFLDTISISPEKNNEEQ